MSSTLTKIVQLGYDVCVKVTVLSAVCTITVEAKQTGDTNDNSLVFKRSCRISHSTLTTAKVDLIPIIQDGLCTELYEKLLEEKAKCSVAT